jgi:hypothetical protein
VNIISKKKDIIELLKRGTDVEEICTDLGVSTSYVYRIKREVDELEGDKEDSPNAEKDDPDGVVVDSPGGNSPDMEGDHKNLEEKEDRTETDKTNRLGGVKRKKKSKKVKKEDKEDDEDTDERTGGLIKWIKKKWKKILLISTLSILLVAMMLSSFLTKNREQEQPQIPNRTMRFPSINH